MIVWGHKAYGRIKAVVGLDIETMFFHLFWVPLLPYRGLITYQKTQSIKSKIRMQSVLAGYGRVWGPILLVLGIALTREQGMAMLGLAAVGAVLAALGWAPQFRALNSTEANHVEQEFAQAVNAMPQPEAPEAQ